MKRGAGHVPVAVVIVRLCLALLVLLLGPAILSVVPLATLGPADSHGREAGHEVPDGPAHLHHVTVYLWHYTRY